MPSKGLSGIIKLENNSSHKPNGGINMIERLTRQQMEKKYPNQYLGIRNIEYLNNDGITLTSADVVYTNKTERELIMIQIEDASISIWYTNDDTPMLGFMG